MSLYFGGGKSHFFSAIVCEKFDTKSGIYLGIFKNLIFASQSNIKMEILSSEPFRAILQMEILSSEPFPAILHFRR